MSPTLPHKERGAVLVTGLLILLLATFIAVSSLNNANVQERMAGNEQDSNAVFQAAESAADFELNKVFADGDLTNLSEASEQYELANPSWPQSSYDIGDASVQTVTEFKSLGRTSLLLSESSIDGNEDADQPPPQAYEIRSTSSMPGSGARITVSRGIIYR